MTEKELIFIKGLEKLTRETGIAIAGCGCCGSPFLEKVKITDYMSGYMGPSDITWIDKSDKFDWKEYRNEIIK